MLAKKRDPGGRRWKSTSRFAAQDFAVADGEGDFGEDGDVLGGGETPAGEHGFELRGEFGGGEFFRMEQAGREDVHVAVPEAGGDDHAFAVDDGDGAGEARRLGGGAGADGSDASVVNEDGGVFERGISETFAPIRARSEARTGCAERNASRMAEIK